MFASKKEQDEMSALLDGWVNDPDKIKVVFLKLRDKLFAMENITLSFKSRQGVSYSLRAFSGNNEEKSSQLFVLIDIIDDDPDNRWISVCFYGDMINDTEEMGDFVPQGLLGKDGHCFDLYDYNESMLLYIEKRIDEAYAKASSLLSAS